MMGLLGFLRGGQQPHFGDLRNPRAKKLLNFWWSKVFYNNDNLGRLASGCPTPSQRLFVQALFIISGYFKWVPSDSLGNTPSNSEPMMSSANSEYSSSNSRFSSAASIAGKTSA